MVLNAYLVDDESKALLLLQNYLDRIPFIQWVGQARDPRKALNYLEKEKVDVLF